MYATLIKIFSKFFTKQQLFKYGFNISPMYRRTTAKIESVSDDLTEIKIKIPKSYKNLNYAKTIFGGSMFSATDPIFMVQLVELLGPNYIIWDKSSTINFKKPAVSDAYSVFTFSHDEIKEIKKSVNNQKKMDIVKTVHITNSDGSVVFAEVSKKIYIADKEYYLNKKVEINNKA